MIGRFLDRYYTEKLVKRLEDRLLEWDLDFKSRIDTKRRNVDIFLKPRKHYEYTHVYHFEESEAFIKLIEFDFIYKEVIVKKIKYLNKNDYWR